MTIRFLMQFSSSMFDRISILISERNYKRILAIHDKMLKKDLIAEQDANFIIGRLIDKWEAGKK